MTPVTMTASRKNSDVYFARDEPWTSVKCLTVTLQRSETYLRVRDIPNDSERNEKFTSYLPSLMHEMQGLSKAETL
jgi:hypothetical protein